MAGFTDLHASIALNYNVIVSYDMFCNLYIVVPCYSSLIGSGMCAKY